MIYEVFLKNPIALLFNPTGQNLSFVYYGHSQDLTESNGLGTFTEIFFHPKEQYERIA
jgi:hypothetical protein